MSKIGKQPVEIPNGVTVSQEEAALRITGPKGTVIVPLLRGIAVSLADGVVRAELGENTPQARANWGTLRSLTHGAVRGVVDGHKKVLQIEGVGYRVSASSPKELVFSLGFSHSISFPIPDSITAEVVDNTITISGADKELVGQIAANIRKLRKPEPYKGKGIRYEGEVVRRKAGKKTA